MKTVYIPKGETVRYESLVTERLIVKGCLEVAYGVKARTISGSGVINAETLSADDIRIDEVEAAKVVCKNLIAKRVEAPEVFASESALVSCYFSAAYVKTGKLTVAINDIDEVEAEEVVNLAAKKRSLLGALLASALRSFWTALTTPAVKGEIMDADYVPAADNAARAETAAPSEEEAEPRQPAGTDADEELNRFVNIFKLCRESGFTLRVIPGTPEENAPVFDFEHERIVKPAA